MKPEIKRYTTTVGTRTVTFETGKLAGQAGGAVTVGIDDAIVFAAATMGGVREGIDFFPLSVEYEERLYAGGKIPGSFFRREGRPSTEAILTARLTDRPLRPLFQYGMRNEVQVMMFSLSADGKNPLDIIAINAASAAIMISDIPWGGPVGAVRVGRLNGEFVINPTFSEVDASDLDLRIAGTKDAILMVECGANEIPEDVMAAALEFGHKSLQPLIETQLKMAAEIGKPKREPVIELANEDLQKKVFERVNARMNELLDKPLNKAEFYGGMDALADAVVTEMCVVPQGANPAEVPTENDVKSAFSEAEQKIVRERILSAGKRPDGRTPTEIRPIWCEVGLSPRAHGSGLFTRGETQVLSLATLGTLGEAQELDLSQSNRYKTLYASLQLSAVLNRRGQTPSQARAAAKSDMVHWQNEPSNRSFLPKRHSLIQSESCPKPYRQTVQLPWVRSVVPPLLQWTLVYPSKHRLLVLQWDLVTDETGRYKILTDIQGTEDHLGDMDFKVAGTAQGITALQMDIKISGLSAQMMKEALEQAHIARMSIMEKMLAVIDSPRSRVKASCSTDNHHQDPR